MRQSIVRRQWSVVAALCIAARVVMAQGAMTYIHNGPESPDDARYNYHWEILRVALEKTKREYGLYELESAPAMTERRQVAELRASTGALNVIILGTTAELERELLPIRIPVDRNLNGFSVFMVRREKLGEMSKVRTAGDLRHIRLGLGQGWLDVDLYRANQMTVVTGSSYDGLFEMLDNGRFDAFPRSVTEAPGELTAHGAKMPDLRIEPTFCVYYPLPMYFWFSRTPEGRRMAARVEKGMWKMIEDGTYDSIFSLYQDYKIRQLKLTERRIIRLRNPYLSAETPLGDKRLWFDPATYRPRP